MAVHDLGELGPKEGAAVTASCRFVDNLSGLAVWVLLVGGIVLLKENRNRQALLILVPFIAVNVLWMGIKFLLAHFANMPSSAAVIFDALVAGLTVGMAVVLLAAGRFKGMNRFVIVLLAFLMMAAAFGAAIAGSMQFDAEALQSGVFFAIMTLAGLIALVVAGAVCRRRFGAGKFLFWLGVWCVLLSAGILLSGVVIAAFVFMGAGERAHFWSEIGRFVVVGGIVGLVVYVFLLPFVVLVLRSDLYRKRLHACFQRKGVPVAEAGGEGNTPNEWRTS